MKHKFKNIAYDARKLLVGCDKLSTFINRVSKQADEDHGMGWTSDEYKGMAFESLIEILVCASPIDKRINIREYRPADSKIDGPDMGIDGYGVSHNKNLHTIQIKFRSNVLCELTTKDMISNFVAKTTSSPMYKDADMTVFTTAKGINQTVLTDMYHGRVRVLGFSELGKLIDNNLAFWDVYRSEMNI